MLTRKIFLCILQCRTSQSPIVRLHVFLTALFSPLLRPSCVRLVVRVSFTGRRLAALFFYYYYFSHFSNEKCRRRRRRKRKTWWNAADLGLGLLVLCAAPESHARLLTFRSLLPLLLLFFLYYYFSFSPFLKPFPDCWFTGRWNLCLSPRLIQRYGWAFWFQERRDRSVGGRF